MKPLGLRIFRWTYGWRKLKLRVKGKLKKVWVETYEDWLVGRPNRGKANREALRDQE